VVVGKPSRRASSITAWCIAAIGALLILGSALLPDGLVVSAARGGIALVALGVAIYSVSLFRR
jgi:hypothetical protein